MQNIQRTPCFSKTTSVLPTCTQSTTTTTTTSLSGGHSIAYSAPNLSDFVAVYSEGKGKGKEKERSGGKQKTNLVVSKADIDQHFNFIGCRHTPQFSDGLFVGVRAKTEGAFPGYIAQKKHKETDPDPNPQTGEHRHVCDSRKIL